MDQLSIATGKNRFTKKWANAKVSWPDLVKRLSKTLRTLETYKEYNALGKEKQSDAKDHGGFVGGYLTDGARHPANVQFRQLLTLDLDYATYEFWEDFSLYYNVSAVLHSTHKHSKKTPRYRLIVPLDRRVNAEEYEAIARRFADTFDINLFDPTTFQPERLMYWPTSSKDAEYIFREQSGPWLCVDDLLASYENWKDISEWPKPDSEKDIIRTGIKKQGVPADKPGLIGAFCRAYPISVAIEEFLSDTYEPTSFDDRYTFIEGSAAAGGIVYGEDEFFYSHHSTDPAHGILCNSFDLVRLHKFGFEDGDSTDKEISKKKSQRLMTEFASDLHEVIKQIGKRTLPEEDFADEYYDSDWLGELTVDKYGKYENRIPNFLKIVKNDPNLRGRFKYDTFHHREVIVCPVPWDASEEERLYIDADDAGLEHYLENVYDIYHATKCQNALKIIFQENTFHPIQRYINSLVWDGLPRLDSLLVDYLGANNTRFTRLATRKALVAAVARVYKPGIKFDHCLTLVGREGIGKSMIFATLAKGWFSDSFVGVEGQKAFEQLHGVWIMEIAELAGFKRSEIEPIKAFISKCIDSFRQAYGKRKEDFARQGIFVATTNDYNFLRENNGNRRFWPVDVTGFGIMDLSELDVSQVWAEAKYFFDHGEKLYFDADVEEEAREAQRLHTEVDERIGLVYNYLNIPLPKAWDTMSIIDRRSYLNDKDQIAETVSQEDGGVERISVCVAEIWSELFRGEPRDMGPHNTKYYHTIMSNIPGWEKASQTFAFPIYGRQRAYTKIGKNTTHFNKRKADRKEDERNR